MNKRPLHNAAPIKNEGQLGTARLRLVWADYQKRVFLLSNLPVEMPVDHLIEFNDLMPDRLEMELIRKGDLPLTPLGLEKMRPDLEMSKEAIKSFSTGAMQMSLKA